MFKRIALLVTLSSLVACGDDESEKETGADTGTPGTGANDAGVAIVPGKVRNVGAECGSAADCEGTSGKTRCLSEETFPLAGGSITYNGGYCSAECTDDRECTGEGGSPGECPFGAMLGMASAFPGIGSLVSGLSVCMEPCTSAADCRSDGYTCGTVGSLLPMNSQIPRELLTSFLPSTKYCLSTDIVVPDAGLGNLLPGGDAGVPDATTGAADASDDEADAEAAPGTDAA